MVSNHPQALFLPRLVPHIFNDFQQKSTSSNTTVRSPSPTSTHSHSPMSTTSELDPISSQASIPCLRVISIHLYRSPPPSSRIHTVPRALSSLSRQAACESFKSIPLSSTSDDFQHTGTRLWMTFLVCLNLCNYKIDLNNFF